MDFQRARSEEQREQRRRIILETATQMLTEMPVAAVSLNELSRRVGLAKSNVLRYFESREAVLLEVLDSETRGWVEDVGRRLSEPHAGSVTARTEELTAAITTSLAARPVLCDLMHAESGVLERNVSTEAVLHHKRATEQTMSVLMSIVVDVLPELGADDAEDVIVTLLLIASAAWPWATPGEALAAAYELDSSVAASHRDLTDIVARTLTLTIRGLLTQL